MVWRKDDSNERLAAHAVVFTSCMSVDVKELHHQEKLNIASWAQPYSILTGPPLYPSLEYVTTICSLCHHCTNHWIQAGQHTPLGPENWRIALSKLTGLCSNIHMVSTQGEQHSASCTILLNGHLLSTRAVCCFPTNPWIMIDVADLLYKKKECVSKWKAHRDEAWEVWDGMIIVGCKKMTCVAAVEGWWAG